MTEDDPTGGCGEAAAFRLKHDVGSVRAGARRRERETDAEALRARLRRTSWRDSRDRRRRPVSAPGKFLRRLEVEEREAVFDEDDPDLEDAGAGA